MLSSLLTVGRVPRPVAEGYHVLSYSGAGDIDAVPGQLEALRVELVDGRHAQRPAKARPVMHREADGVGHPQHGIGRRDVTAFQRGADAGGGNRLLLKLCHRQDDYLHAQRLRRADAAAPVCLPPWHRR